MLKLVVLVRRGINQLCNGSSCSGVAWGNKKLVGISISKSTTR
jgi:hypothetical protein